MVEGVVDRTQEQSAAPAKGRRFGDYEKCPEETTNWLSFLWYSWFTPVISLGRTQALQTEDLFPLRSDLQGQENYDRFQPHWDKAVQSNAKSTLISALWGTFGTRFCIYGVLRALADGFGIASPIILEQLLDFLQESRDGVNVPPAWKGYVWAVLLFVFPVLGTVTLNFYFRLTMTMGHRARNALVSAIYRKSLRLSPKARSIMSTGQIVNMMSTDASKIDLLFGYLHYVWSAVLQVAVIVYLLVRALGPAALAGVAVLLLFIPIQKMVTGKLGQLRGETAGFADKRIKLMNEILQGIRVIKYYAWELPFMKKVQDVRGDEVSRIRTRALWSGFNYSVMQLGPIFMTLLAFLTMDWSGQALSPKRVFSAIVLFTMLRFPLLIYPMVVGMIADGQVAVRRIEGFLKSEELDSAPDTLNDPQLAVRIQGGSFTWETDSKKKPEEKKAATGNKPTQPEEKKAEEENKSSEPIVTLRKLSLIHI